jgi:hypothetical protein
MLQAAIKRNSANFYHNFFYKLTKSESASLKSPCMQHYCRKTPYLALLLLTNFVAEVGRCELRGGGGSGADIVLSRSITICEN